MLAQHNDLPPALNELATTIVDCCFHVHQELGPGFFEKIYEDALSEEMQSRNISFQRQAPYTIMYKGKSLDTAFRFDLVVENQLLLELKAVEQLNTIHQSQIYAYLKAANMPLGFLINFNVDRIKDGISRYKNKHFDSSSLRVEKTTETMS